MKDIQEREKLAAIHDDNLKEYLSNLGEYHKVIEGKCKCKFCSRTITMDNISSMFPESGTIKYVCDDMKCVVKMSQYFTNNQ